MRRIDADEYIKYLTKQKMNCEEFGDKKSAERYQATINEINKLPTIEENVANLEEIKTIIELKILTEQKKFLDSSFTDDNVFKAGVAFGLGVCLGIVLKTLEEMEIKK